MATVSAERRTAEPVPETRTVPDPFPICIPASACTLAGFRDWATSDAFPQDIRAAFIGGEIYLEMSNEDPETHVGVKDEITQVIRPLVRQLQIGKYYGDGVLVTHEEAGLSNNPDASFFTNESLASGRLRLVPRAGKPDTYRELEGTPDWVAEVISDSSVKKDTEKLRKLYHKAGVAEYWLIDARGDEVLFTILHRRKKGYAAAPVRDGWQYSRVFTHWFRLERQRDQLGLWEYTLHVRAK